MNDLIMNFIILFEDQVLELPNRDKYKNDKQKHKDSIAQYRAWNFCSNDAGYSSVEPLWIKKLRCAPDSDSQSDFNAAGVGKTLFKQSYGRSAG